LSRDEDSESNNECRQEKPTEGDVFDNFDEAYNMYLEYAEKARFSIRKFTTKRKKGEITHKYILCSKVGKPKKTMVKDTLVQDNQNEVNQNDAFTIRDADIMDHMKKQTEKQKGNQKVRLCGMCHQPGHNVLTCTKKKNKGYEENVAAFPPEE
nr:protein FAR1-related sequence 5-like [Tanacetum cinerariifolium]